MKIIENVNDMREFSRENPGCGFVPTMGALHAGHLSLILESIKNNNSTVVSLFVNQTQFDNKEDFQTYPSTLKEDLDLLEKAGVSAVFLPSFNEIYPDNYRYKIQEKDESLLLCGANRPGHFDGVLTVVMKLFQIVKPARAYFGEKDFQQLELIKGMVEAFFLDIDIVPGPIVRDREGLALSSRNVRLRPQALAKARFFAKKLRDSENLEELTEQLRDQEIEIDYLKIWKGRRLAAVKIDNVRLIDNVSV